MKLKGFYAVLLLRLSITIKSPGNDGLTKEFYEGLTYRHKRNKKDRIPFIFQQWKKKERDIKINGA